MSPAFKEWQVIVGALVEGSQILILRKGGVAEVRDGFAVGASRFWLFPTAFHAQREKTKPTVHRGFQPADDPGSVVIQAFADVYHHRFLNDWDSVRALDPHHAWTESTVRERFDWAKPPGIHAIWVRVHRLRSPLRMAVTPAMAGCRSWIEVPFAFADLVSDPVLDDDAFAARVQAIGI